MHWYDLFQIYFFFLNRNNYFFCLIFHLDYECWMNCFHFISFKSLSLFLSVPNIILILNLLFYKLQNLSENFNFLKMNWIDYFKMKRLHLVGFSSLSYFAENSALRLSSCKLLLLYRNAIYEGWIKMIKQINHVHETSKTSSCKS